MLDFLPGEKLKFINVTIVDNAVPELDKIFRVELYNAGGGGENSASKLKSCVYPYNICATYSFSFNSVLFSENL